MPPFLPLSAPRLLRWAGRLSTLVMLALLAWLVATVFWRLNTPATVAPPGAMETDPARAAQTIAGRHLFGEAPKAGPAVVTPSAAADIALRGVVAPSRAGQPGIAVLAIAGKAPVSVREGDEVAPGVRLRKVLPTSVDIERDSRVQTLPLPERGKREPARKEAR